MVQNGIYADASFYNGKTVFVMLNGTDSETTVSLKYYQEILTGERKAKDILSGKEIMLMNNLTMAPRESLVLELD